MQSPCPKIFGNDRCTVEGMAFRKAEHGIPELLLGVQKTGEKSTLAIIRLHQKLQPETGDRIWDDGEKIFPSGDDTSVGRFGIDAMLRAGGGVPIWQPHPRDGCTSRPASSLAPTVHKQGAAQREHPRLAVRYGLWTWGCNAAEPRDPCRCSEQKATLLETFIHKPDGVSHDNGSVLVVFDDEAWRKSHQWAPKTLSRWATRTKRCLRSSRLRSLFRQLKTALRHFLRIHGRTLTSAWQNHPLPFAKTRNGSQPSRAVCRPCGANRET